MKELEEIDLSLTDQDIENGEKKLRLIKGQKINENDASWKIDEKLFDAPVSGPRTGKFKVKDIDAVCKIVLEEYGLKTRVAKRLDISVPTLYKMIARNEKLKQTFEQATDKILDIAESALIQKVLAKDTAATLFLLKTVGAKRGYTEKIEAKITERPIFVMKEKPTNDKK